ncbi:MULTISPECIES: Crp/Fnr family transcriptional regulator [unclassified Virgibacillus]|uniref:Crp/Fnr family transcriptional regulator n=1 Tax=unclassified Virgibacillus TaxID=2620237 RepID=UPI0024DE6C56|nr:Crp/Fnr family transcriptional regulator [Virgibacillus sp. LDC-1]
MKKNEAVSSCSIDKKRGCVSSVPIFNHLTNDQMKEIEAVVNAVTYQKGHTIYRAGECADTLYIVNEGRIRIYRLSEAGKEQLVRIIHAGEFSGELSIFKDTVHESYAEAMDNVTICKISRSSFQKLLLKFPSISLKLLEEFANRLEQSEVQTTRFATESVESRIALYLVEISSNDTNEVILPMSHKDLASYLGTTPETVSRVFHTLQSKGYIKKISPKRFMILDIDGLTQA